MTGWSLHRFVFQFVSYTNTAHAELPDKDIHFKRLPSIGTETLNPLSLSDMTTTALNNTSTIIFTNRREQRFKN